MKFIKITTIFILFSLFAFQSCKVSDVDSNSKPISHAIWDSLLRKHVTDDGWVDYEGFIQDSTTFNKYISLLSNHHPNKKNWSDDERKAYWINAYNAFTLQIVMRHYPVESIKDIASSIPFVNTVWDIKFIYIEGVNYDINNIEHGILRPKFGDPRVHAAVNCASISCPRLLNEAYEAQKIDKQLDKQVAAFVNDPTRNNIVSGKAELSKIFKWYGGDFDDKIKFINRYSSQKIDASTDISYLDYNWQLNKQ